MGSVRTHIAASAVMLAVTAWLGTGGAGAAQDPLALAESWLQVLINTAQAGDAAGAQAAALEYANAIQRAVREIQQGATGPRGHKGLPPGIATAARRVREATWRHLQVLYALLPHLSPQAEPAVEHAIQAASKGYEQAMAALQASAARSVGLHGAGQQEAGTRRRGKP